MTFDNHIFERTEKKYQLDVEQKDALLHLIGARLESDRFGQSAVSSLYFDTDDHLLIRRSLEKPLYKEKLRLRSYGTPQLNSKVFFELKKKYAGVVYKRRETLRLCAVKQYLADNVLPCDTQIMREIDWLRRTLPGLHPAMLIAYDREALFSRENHDLRLTFDSSLRCRTDDLLLESGSYGRPILADDRYIMEIKSATAMPLWLADSLDALHIYPTPFSKYGTAYEKFICPGGVSCSTHSFNPCLATASLSATTCFAQ